MPEGALLSKPARNRADQYRPGSSRKQAGTDGFTLKVLSWAGAALISIVGLIHLLLVGEHFEAATYLGLMFLANFVGAAVAALGIYLGAYRWAWLLGGWSPAGRSWGS